MPGRPEVRKDPEPNRLRGRIGVQNMACVSDTGRVRIHQAIISSGLGTAHALAHAKSIRNVFQEK